MSELPEGWSHSLDATGLVFEATEGDTTTRLAIPPMSPARARLLADALENYARSVETTEEGGGQ